MVRLLMLSDKSKSDVASLQAVSLQQILDAREQRALRQQHCLQQFKQPLISASLVIPGANKRTSTSLMIAKALDQAMQQLIKQQQWLVLFERHFDFITGYEQLWVIDLSAVQLKGALCQLEQRHPLGRLWDLDVIDIDGTIISRTQLGLSARSCLVCAQPAHFCARAGTHSIAELQAVIEQKVKQYAGE